MIEVKNALNDYEKAIELVLALEESAAEVLQSIPKNSGNNLIELMAALREKTNESLQDVATAHKPV